MARRFRRVELDSEIADPYVRTSVFVRDGKTFYGIWNPPEVTLDGDEELFTVPQGHQGQLDLLADDVYEDRVFWQAIAHANKFHFPHEDVVAGMQIVIPKQERVRAAYRATSSRVREP